MLGTQALGALALGQGPSAAVVDTTLPLRGRLIRRWTRNRGKEKYDWAAHDRRNREEIEALEAARDAALKAQEAKRDQDRRKRAAEAQALLVQAELQTSAIVAQIKAMRAAEITAHLAKLVNEIDAALQEARATEAYLKRRKRDEQAAAMLLLSDF